MDATTIDQEFAQLQAEFQDVAKTVESLATKMQAAEKDGDAHAADWLTDLKHVAQDIDDEQEQVKKLLLAVHDFVGKVAEAHQAAAGEEKPPLFAPGHEPTEEADPQQQSGQHHGVLGELLGGVRGGPMMGGGMMGGMGGGMFGGYYGGGFGQAMAMGMAMNLGSNLVANIFR